MDRPALTRLLDDIEAGKIDCVVVYKVDRLSRSLLDFARMMEIFDRHKVSFVSVTQQFNTSTSMGRLILNVLLSFAQFEREMISERTRDKMRAARRKGKYVGGTPILGYDVDRGAKKLIVNRDEAERARAIFQLYLELGALLPVAQELERRGWTNKRWTTKTDTVRGGKPFTKTSLHKLLTNVTYVGKTENQGEIFRGEQPAIVPNELWERVQHLLKRNSRNGGASAKNSGGALLKGLLHCSACNCSMSPTASSVRGGRRYRYYVCCGAQKRGWASCPSKSIPAEEIEKFVIEQIRSIGRDPSLIRETIAAVQRQSKEQTALLTAEERILIRDLAKWHERLRKLTGKADTLAVTADLQEQIGSAEQRLGHVQDQRTA
jgi:site-specific DNA recombinase